MKIWNMQFVSVWWDEDEWKKMKFWWMQKDDNANDEFISDEAKNFCKGWENFIFYK